MRGLCDNYDIETENYCLSMSNIDYLAPYKNKFCEICNKEYGHEGLLGWVEFSNGILNAIDNGFKLPSLRFVFEFLVVELVS